MSEKIKTGLKLFLLLTLCVLPLGVFAHEDDYIVGLSSFRDGLYDISTPSLEAYLSGETEARKADYAHYLLYQIYLSSEKYSDSIKHLNNISDVADRRFDAGRMKTDRMLLLTKTDCSGAGKYLSDANDELSLNIYLDSKCVPDDKQAEIIISKAVATDTKLKVVSRFSDKPDVVKGIFDSLKLSKLTADSKKYFAIYFYNLNDMERFEKVRAVYEDGDVVGLELDRLWKADDKEGFITAYEKYNPKYKLAGANACRAIDVYRKKDVAFDCNIINECMQGYSIDFVKAKGACLVKSGEKDKLTSFIDSLKPTIFPGMCSYGEYIFYNELYTGKSHSKFYQCDERYKIADILLKKGEFQPVVNMFFSRGNDTDRYYAAAALRGLGKKEAADSLASQITDEALKARYNGGE